MNGEILTGRLFGPAPVRNADGSLKHVIKEGSREHVIWYDINGAHCSESECEINRKRVR